jgi:uncharacterized membrane protein
MNKGRMEAFSDGVIAVIITVMVLELRAPHGHSLAALRPLEMKFLCYVLSFAFVGIYWNNHHHMLQAVSRVDGRVLWANHHLLFWLSLVPFVTDWAGETHFAPWPAALYGAVLLLAAVAYTLLSQALIACHEKNAVLAAAIGKDFKGKISLALYAAAIPLAFLHPRISFAIYVGVAVLWFIPDRRIEQVLRS